MGKRTVKAIKRKWLESLGEGTYSTVQTARILRLPLNMVSNAARSGELKSKEVPFHIPAGRKFVSTSAQIADWVKSCASIALVDDSPPVRRAYTTASVDSGGYQSINKKLEEAVYKILEVVDDIKKLENGNSLRGRVESAFA